MKHLFDNVVVAVAKLAAALLHLPFNERNDNG